MTSKNTMGKYNKYIDIDVLADEALANSSQLSSKTAMLVDQLADAIDCIKKLAPDKYFKHYIHFHKIVHGPQFDENLYDYAVSLMKNTDGSAGPILSKSQISEEARKHGLVPTALYNAWDIAYIASMYLSDMWDKSLSNDENIAFAMRAAKGFLNDPDAPQQPGRALRFFAKIAMWNPDK